MAASSIGQPVILTEERAERLMGIITCPYRPTHPESGKRLKVTPVADLQLDPKKFE